LWSREHKRGQEEGVKDRPWAVILVTADKDGDRVVTVPQISHTPRRSGARRRNPCAGEAPPQAR
jgi:hypothetical protein